MNLWTRLAQFQFFDSQDLHFRPFFFSDDEDLYEIASNPENLAFIFPQVKDRAECQFLLANYFMKEPLGIWAMTNHEGKMVGAIRFEKIDQIKLQAEIGYFLNQAFWGQGLMTQALKRLTRLAFNDLGMNRLVLVCHLENRASQKVALKAGFQLNRQFKGSDRYSRKMRDYLEYQLLRGDFYE